MNGFRDGESPPAGTPKTSPGSVNGKAIPPGGCVSEVNNQLLGTRSIDEQFPLAGNLAVQAFQNAQADPRVLGYFSDWSTCLKKKGYNYADPFKAGVEFTRPPESKPSAKEVQAALAVIKCKESTRLILRWQAVNIEYEKKAIEKNQLALTEERNRLDKSLAISAKIAANQVN